MSLYLYTCLIVLAISTGYAIKQFFNRVVINQLRLYIKFLLPYWKLSSFLLAATLLILIAPYTGDITWDYYNAAIMSILTYLTAPWSVGVFFRFFRYKARKKHLLLAIVLLMLSASWSYDWYLLWRDGSYPVTWDVNIIPSSFLYILAGLLWNLESTTQGLIFSFMRREWFYGAITSSLSAPHLIVGSAIAMLAASPIFIYFVLPLLKN